MGDGNDQISPRVRHAIESIESLAEEANSLQVGLIRRIINKLE
jgi:hypothetical protein